MFCIECGTRNPENAKFCKRCGHPMPKPDPAEEPASEPAVQTDPTVQVETIDPAVRARDLMLSAFRLREAGDLDGALDAARQVAALQPDNVSAHALLSTLHEHKGDIDAAIAEREKVLELAPDSDTDREKLELLRKGVRQAAPLHIISPKPIGKSVLFEKRPSPAAVAIVAFLLVAIVGSASVLWYNRGGQKPAPARLAQAPAPSASQPIAPAPSAFTAPPATVAQPADRQQMPQGGAPGPVQQPSYEQPYAQRRRASGGFAGMEDNRDVPPAPVTIPNNGGLERDTRAGQQPAEPDASAFHLPDRTPGAGSVNPNANVVPQPPSSPPRDPGHIEIILAPDPTSAARTGSKPPAGGSNGGSRSSAASEPSLDSRARRAIAQEYQMKGDYARAANEYKRALEGAGDDAGLIHQKIALCYQRLDQRESAIAHYNDAIRAFQQLKAAGRNVDLAEEGIRASQAGIANCK